MITGRGILAFSRERVAPSKEELHQRLSKDKGQHEELE
jgi:hypothetical protein